MFHFVLCLIFIAYMLVYLLALLRIYYLVPEIALGLFTLAFTIGSLCILIPLAELFET